jgi:prepilin signal peptidase PulO-like enzyme (type II secretory pathway)
MSNLTIPFTLAFFALGTIVGSFISMMNYRTKHEVKGKATGRSFCPHCKVKLKPYDMIPLLSYMFLGGKCRGCDKKISVNYFFTELVTGFLFASLFMTFNFIDVPTIEPMKTVLWLMIFAVGSAIFFFDLKYLEVPMLYSIAFATLGIVGGYFLVGNTVYEMLLGGLIGKGFFWIQHVASKGKWVGLGDSDIALGMGLLLGPLNLLIALMFSYLLGSIIGVALLATKKASRKTQLPFGPFLITGLYITVVYGQQIMDWYFNISF